MGDIWNEITSFFLNPNDNLGPLGWWKQIKSLSKMSGNVSFGFWLQNTKVLTFFEKFAKISIKQWHYAPIPTGNSYGKDIFVFPVSLLSTETAHRKLIKYFVCLIYYLLHLRRKAHRWFFHLSNTWWCHQMETPSVFTGPLWGEYAGRRWIPLTKASDAELWCFLWSTPEQTVEQTIETPVIWDAITVMQDVQLSRGHGKEASGWGIKYLSLDWSVQ